MPPRNELVHTLDGVAGGYASVALVWNVLLLGWLAYLLWSRQAPPRRLAFAIAAAPLLSAAALCGLAGNPLDALALIALVIASIVVGRKLPAGSTELAFGGRRMLAVLAIVLASWHPSSLSAESPLPRFLHGPIGVLPAPTLLWLSGASLLCLGFAARAWSYGVAAFSIGYALFGAGVLGCWLDLALIPPALALITTALGSRRDQAALTLERDRIDAFLLLRSIAFVGLSRHDADLSRAISHALRERGVEVIPVHPFAPVIGDQLAYPKVTDLPKPPEGALLMTPSEQSVQVVRDCARAGIRHLWFHQGVGRGAASPEALELARSCGMSVVSGRCIMMFLDHAPVSVHRVHAAAQRALGRYPTCAG